MRIYILLQKVFWLTIEQLGKSFFVCIAMEEKTAKSLNPPELPEVVNSRQVYDDDSIDFDPKEQARILRKVDFYLLPIITLLYLMSFLDRSSIGNAKISGLVKDLNLKPVQYNIALSLFFVSYVSFEVDIFDTFWFG